MAETSLSKVVYSLIERDLSIQDALLRDYANYSAIARMLKPKIENILNREVKLSGIITAVKRVRIKYRERSEHLRIIARSIINLRTDVAKISLEKTRRTIELTRRTLANYPEAFLQVLEGFTTLTLIVDQKIFNQISRMFRSDEVLDRKENLAALIIQSPREIVDTPGCISALYMQLARNQINIEETVSCYTETIIILKMEDIGEALTLLTDMITDARKITGEAEGYTARQQT